VRRNPSRPHSGRHLARRVKKKLLKRALPSLFNQNVLNLNTNIYYHFKKEYDNE